ncbi:MAG: hypothetical protein IKO72_02635 [Kiritimatiellae bacterium]|nr:hypothetical protein [Kiritimatiellia bacterium]
MKNNLQTINRANRFLGNNPMVKPIGMLSLLCVLSGCMTNRYEEYYVNKDSAYYDALNAIKTPNQQVELKIATSEEDVINIIEDGYLPIGVSSFWAPYNGMTCAVDTAEKHGAQLILFDIKFKKTKEYTSVLLLPSTSTSYTYGTVNATAYGRGGTTFGTGTYSGTTSTTTLNAVPVKRSVDIYTHNALYFKKIDPKAFYGIVPFIPRRLPTESADAIVPVTVLGVVHGSKAETDGFKRGQRIIAINGVPISNRKSIAQFSNSITSIKSVEVAQ